MRNARVERGFSQGKLAELSRTSQSTITRIETGDSMPQADLALRLAAVLGLPLEQLLEVSDESAPPATAEAHQ